MTARKALGDDEILEALCVMDDEDMGELCDDESITDMDASRGVNDEDCCVNESIVRTKNEEEDVMNL